MLFVKEQREKEENMVIELIDQLERGREKCINSKPLQSNRNPYFPRLPILKHKIDRGRSIWIEFQGEKNWSDPQSYHWSVKGEKKEKEN